MESDEAFGKRVSKGVAQSRAASNERAKRRRLSSCVVADSPHGAQLLEAAERLLNGEKPDARRNVYPTIDLGEKLVVHVYPRVERGEHDMQEYVLTGDPKSKGRVTLTHYTLGCLVLRGAEGQLTLGRKEDELISIRRRDMNPSGRASVRVPARGTTIAGSRR